MKPIALALTVLAASASYADVTFSQSDWPTTPGSDYNYFMDQSNVTNWSNSTPQTGGNPGSYQFFYDEFHNLGIVSFQQGVIMSNWAYNPATQGAITNVEFSGDQLPGFPGDGYGNALFVEQGGNTYMSFNWTGYFNSWTHFDSTNPSGIYDFYLLKGDGSVNYGSNPDFSSHGSEIHFGYGFFAAFTNGYSLNFDGLGYDNVNIKVSSAAVPEQGSVLILGLPALAFLLRKRS